MLSLFGFLEYLENEKKYSIHTIKAYKKDLQDFGSFIEDSFELQSLLHVDYFQVRAWIAELSKEELAHKSINRKLSSLKSFYKYLMKIGEIDFSPVQKLKSLKTPKTLSVPFSETEIIKVLASMNHDDFVSVRNALIIRFLYATGMRRAELIALKNKDINLPSRIVRITGKRNKQRIVPLNGSLLDYITQYNALRIELNMTNLHFFVTENDQSMYPSLVYNIVNDVFTLYSNKTKTSPHILRHSFATHLLNNGANLNAIKELLGHESLSSTEIYTQNSIEQLKQSYNNSHPREA